MKTECTKNMNEIKNRVFIVNRGEAGRKTIPNIQAKASHVLNFLRMFEIVNIIMLAYLSHLLSDITSQTYNKMLTSTRKMYFPKLSNKVKILSHTPQDVQFLLVVEFC